MNKAEPLYLLLGPETGLKNAFIGEIREALAKAHGEPPEEYRFYSFETSIQQVVSLLRNTSLFSASRLVLFLGAEEIRKKEDVALLANYAANPSREGVLLLLSEKVQLDRKILETASPAGKKIFWELYDNQKKSWVVSCFHRYKARIGSEAADLFLDLVENNTEELERECRNLCFFLGENAEITVQDIEAHLYHGKQESVFSLFETVCALDLESSLEILSKLMLEGDSQPVQLLAGLLWQFRNLQSFKILAAKNFSPADAFTRLKITSKRNQRIYADAGTRFSAGELENIIALCADFDEELRSAGRDLQTRLLEIFLYCVITRKGANILSRAS